MSDSEKYFLATDTPHRRYQVFGITSKGREKRHQMPAGRLTRQNYRFRNWVFFVILAILVGAVTLALLNLMHANRKPKGATAMQTKMTAEGFPKEPPEALCTARDKFLSAKRSAAKAIEKRENAKVVLIDTMKEMGIDRIRLDGENKYFELEDKPNLSIKTYKGDKDAAEE